MSPTDLGVADPPSNRVLAALPPAEYAELVPFLEQVALPFRQVLHEPGQVIPFVYFPNNDDLSIICPEEGKGMGIEVGVGGRRRNGRVVRPSRRGLPARSSASCRCPGNAVRMRRPLPPARGPRDLALHGHLLRYTHAFLAQVSQSVFCNSLHPIEKRMCRWLLTVHDPAGTDRFPITHEFLAAMLGVRRASVTVAARGAASAGMIRYGGGQMTVLDRSALHSAACGCYRAVHTEIERALPKSEPRADV